MQLLPIIGHDTLNEKLINQISDRVSNNVVAHGIYSFFFSKYLRLLDAGKEPS